ncbi:right-handed parallel beta-helix repeat-containing protein [Aurantiacibacter xanthus]|uniref:Right-handed parallel beta-helix repeat-containing protein n=1 Tax=Aurantiacibacter xanthus TaxID=1784712 RepID=A0A3A1P179_9SPHN|nr:right-handed parallel beta-helix repeat-containing protein [Aurantiacibacter xanthus]RIV81082.1 right-handed parallel beta-helix repeat-containing protein [Aurantiacibacter xanthus]
MYRVAALLVMVAGPAVAQAQAGGDWPDLPVYAPAPRDPDAHLSIVIPIRPEGEPVVLHVAPEGDDAGDGSLARPVASLTRAQQLVRALNSSTDVTVSLAAGTYRLAEPLRFTAEDGGRNGHVVRWVGEAGAFPVLSGAVEVDGWTLFDAPRNIWRAKIAPGTDARQLSVNGTLAQRARIEIPRSAVRFAPWGLELLDPAWRTLAQLPQQDRIEIEGMSWFTHRHAMVARISGDRIEMQQPGWRNNLIGYDTLARPISQEVARLFLVNSRAFMREAGQWYADPEEGWLYYRAEPGDDMAAASVEMPVLERLLSIGGTLEEPVRDLEFSGLAFRNTSWLQPSGAEGYASQQSGAYIAGDLADYPDDPIRDCSWGCPAFERMRNHWRQQPAAVQVSAAVRVVFSGNHFSQLGQIALGIGNNPEAHASGVGLAAQAIEVRGNRFEDLAGGAIMAGGITRDAHHPSDSRMGLRDIIVTDNCITGVSHDYKEQAAILVTYASGAVIMHNTISDTPYDGIDVGWGWGINDPGGSAEYFRWHRSYYDDPENLVYDTPTILRDTVIVGNDVSNVKQWFPDGGAIYHLSADPGALIARNYVHDVAGTGGIAIYLDEGSREVRVRENVIDRVGGVWLNLNSQDSIKPRRTATDNEATENWYNSGRLQGDWSAYVNNVAARNVAVEGQQWPEGAREVMAQAGTRTDACTLSAR